MPTVSVIIPTYNRASLLPRAIHSVLNQTYQDFEVIIVDDCSTDNTEQVVASYKDSRILYICLDQNSGSSAKPRNIGLKQATGKYIALLDSDDEWLPENLEKQVTKFSLVSKEVGVVYCGLLMIPQNGIPTISHPILKGSLWPLMLERCYTSVSSSLIKKECFDRAGLFDETSLVPHYDMWIRLAKYYEFDYIPETLTKYHQHPNQFSNNKLREIQALEVLLEKYHKDYQKYPAELRRAQLTLVLTYSLIDKRKSLKYMMPPLQHFYELSWKQYIIIVVVLTRIVSPRLLHIIVKIKHRIKKKGK